MKMEIQKFRWIGNQHGIRFINGKFGWGNVQKIELNVKCTSWAPTLAYLEETIFLTENGNLHYISLIKKKR